MKIIYRNAVRILCERNNVVQPWPWLVERGFLVAYLHPVMTRDIVLAVNAEHVFEPELNDAAWSLKNMSMCVTIGRCRGVASVKKRCRLQNNAVA